jgi:hypothetical protein
MGAYNWFRASTPCYQCGREFFNVYQVHIGWCRYESYVLGDELGWMNEKERQRSKYELKEGQPELRTMVEAGSPNWRDFLTSAGDDYCCPYCNAQGSILIYIKANKFDSATFAPERVRYGTVILDSQRIELVGKLP